MKHAPYTLILSIFFFKFVQVAIFADIQVLRYEF